MISIGLLKREDAIYEGNFDGCQVINARFDAKRLLDEIDNDDEVKKGGEVRAL